MIMLKIIIASSFALVQEKYPGPLIRTDHAGKINVNEKISHWKIPLIHAILSTKSWIFFAINKQYFLIIFL